MQVNDFQLREVNCEVAARLQHKRSIYFLLPRGRHAPVKINAISLEKIMKN